MKKAVWTAVDPATSRLACVSLIAAGISMGLAGLVSLTVSAVSVAAMVAAAVALPRLDGPRWADMRVRPWIGLAGLIAVLVVGRFFQAPTSTTRTSFAAQNLSDPKLAGLMAAFAAGVLVVIAYECGERRGLYAAVVLSVSVTALTTLSSPGKQMIPAIAIGWPAALLSMTRMTAHMHRLAEVTNVATTTVDRLTARLIPRRETIILGVAVLLAGFMIVAGHIVHPKGASLDPVGRGSGRALAARDAKQRDVSTYFGETLTLRTKGDLDPRPFADVPSDSPQLWRMGTLNAYDSVAGPGWTAADNQSPRPSLIDSGLGDVMVLRPLNDVAEPISNTIRTYHVGVRTAWAGAGILAPGPVSDVASSVLAQGVKEAVIVAPSAGDRLSLRGEVPAGSSYDVTSTALFSADNASDDSTLRGIPVSDPDRPDEIRYLYQPLPSSVPARVTQLGRRLVKNSPDLLSAVRAVQAEVRSRIVYREAPPIAAAGTDAVDDALFTTHQGRSEQFASAEVVLLRAGGVPARVAVGFAGGDQHGATRTLRDSDARAWAEVWFPGWGWVTSDPTPAALAKVSVWQSVREHAASAVHAAYSATLAYPIRLAFDSVILLALITYAIMTRRAALRRRRAIRGPNGQPIHPALIAALIRLERALRGRGERPLQQTPQTLGTRLGELAAARPVLAERLLKAGSPGRDPAAALLVLERALDAPNPPPDNVSRGSAALLERVARDVRRSTPGWFRKGRLLRR